MDRAVYVTLKQRHQRQIIEDKRRAVNQVPMLAVLSQVGTASSCLHIPTVPSCLQYSLHLEVECNKQNEQPAY